MDFSHIFDNNSCLWDYFQLEIEKYIKTQNSIYGITIGRERMSYMPALLYYTIDRDEMFIKSRYMPYITKKELKEFGSRGFYDEYIVYCYFAESEISGWLNEK
ncbi:MAG: hypothetical protein HC831_12725 [Chloroflexia bacterium]|nr:hypothetical protein [Chloroflexia bacterium]